MVQETSKALRIISIYERLNKGETLKRESLASEYSVSTKTITRDIKELDLYLSSISNNRDNRAIKYSRESGGYILEHKDNNWLTSREILGMTKVLLESRAFNKQEMDLLLDKLIEKVTPSSRKHLKEIISNERYHYTPVKHKKPLLNTIWQLSKAIRQQKIVEIKYEKPVKNELISRTIDPLGIMFSEFYFYLIAHSHKSEDDYKIVYRLDRISDFNITDEHFNIKYTDRFQEGRFRKRVQFMTAGKLMTVKFKFTGNMEVVLDRLPTARILEKINNSCIFEAEVYGPGIKMWFLSQGDRLEVLSPPEIRQDLRNTIKNMLDNYKK